MAAFGQFALALGFVVTVYSIGASLLGIRLGNDRLIASGRNAGIGAFACLSSATVSLAYLFLTNDFSISYVASNSNRDLPFFYKIAAVWGGQEGSLLFWGWILTVYAALVFIQNRRRHTAMMPYVVAVLMAGSLFFTSMSLFVTNPFHELVLVQNDGTLMAFTPADGRGLNPLLQYVLNVIHPPMLYFGLVGFAVPFAFAMGAMASRQLGDTWIRTTRRWTMIAWFLLGTGVMLGGKWAYVELGWGGYWAWDPVENASLMPWLLGTAFLHSVMIQEKKGMLKVWNMVLVIMTYTMALFGTFLTRSGIISSVHAFAQSNIGGYFLAYIILVVSFAFYLLVDRRGYLKTENTLEAVASRESGFMFNNLLFVAACFAVFWGTMLPVFSEWIQDTKITVAPPWYTEVMNPIGLGLLFLTGVGPLLAWRRSSINSLKRAFLMPGTFALAGTAVLFAVGIRHISALIALTLAIFVSTTIFIEFFKGARARRSSTGENFVEALVNLTLRNTRRYGGYVVHFGIVLLFVGFSGQAFNTDVQNDLAIGDTISINQYVLRVDDLRTQDTANYQSSQAVVSLFKDGEKVAIMYPERRFYPASEQATSEVAIRSNLVEDVYVYFAGYTPDGSKATIQVFLNPMVMWVWIGGIVVALGTMIALLPNKRTTPSKKRKRKDSEEIEEPRETENIHA
jgi:cytochrome c-type biogenesis protein CcmF